MRILQVIHGYPMRYNAGSEVYTQGLSQALADHHEVHVFTRQDDPFLPDYVMREERTRTIRASRSTSPTWRGPSHAEPMTPWSRGAASTSSRCSYRTACRAEGCWT